MAYSFYSSGIFDTSAVDNINTIPLGNDRIFIAWRADGDSDKGKCAVATINNNSISFSKAVFTESDIFSLDACLIDTDKIALAYQDNTNSNEIYSVIITISDNDITVGTPQQINTTAVQIANVNVSICSPDTNKIVFFYDTYNGSSYSAYMIAGTVSGTVITLGSEDLIAASSLNNQRLAKIDTDKIIYFYNSGSNGFVRCRTLTGTTLNAQGTALQISELGVSHIPSLKQLDTNKATLFMESGGDNSNSSDDGEHFYIFTASGTTLTETEDEIIKLQTTSSAFRSVSSFKINENLVAIIYYDVDESEYYIRDVTISSNTVISIGDTQLFTDKSIDASSLRHVSISFLDKALETDPNIGLIAFANNTDINGMAVILRSSPLYELEPKRNIVQSFLASWKKNFTSTYTIFTIGSSTIGGGDYINSSGGVNSDWNKYDYEDESANVIMLNYERELNIPLGGVSKGIGDVSFDNTTQRYTPEFMGGNSALFTVANLPRRPIIINAGFNHDGIDDMEPQFVGITNKSPNIDMRNRQADYHYADFIDFIQNRYVDETAMFTGLRSDQLIDTFLTNLGFATAQYELDTGINTIPFLLAERGAKFADIINDITQAENAQFYQDEEGILRFENRQHWTEAPHTNVQRIITTSQVIDATSPSDDHIINSVEITSTPRAKQPSAEIYSLVGTITLNPGNNEVFVNFDNPVLAANAPSYTVNSSEDGSGSDVTSSVNIVSTNLFAQAVKYVFKNNTSAIVYITALTINGREATVQDTVYVKKTDDSSLTAFEERPITINNNYIQTKTWAESFAQLILDDFSEPEKLQKIKIRAIASLKLGDLISWQGKSWRVYGISTVIDASEGFVQELSLLQRNVVTYFRIGISLIGGNDGIAP